MQRIATISEDEMQRTFNLGIGMAIIVSAADEHKAIDQLRLHGHRAHRIGEIVAGSGAVRFSA